MGWRLSLAAVVLLLLWPMLAQAKRGEAPWGSEVALAELDGKPVIAFSPWDRWQPALGKSALQFAYAKSTRPSSPQDWVLAPCKDPKLSTNGREYLNGLALLSDADKLYYGVQAHYTRPDGQRLRTAFLWGRMDPSGSGEGACSSEVSGKFDPSFWMTESAILSSVPLFSYVLYPDDNNRSTLALRVISATESNPSVTSQWQTDEIDQAASISAIALALVGDTILACYKAQRSTAAGKTGIVLQQGRRQADGTLSWRVLCVLHPIRATEGGLMLLAGAERVYLFCSTETELVMASCPLGQLETKAKWDVSVIHTGLYVALADARMLGDVPALLYSDSTADCIIALANSPMPQQPQDWSCVRFPTGINANGMWGPYGLKLGALQVIDGTPAIAYQCETPRGIAYAWTDKAQPRQAADWRTSLVFSEASIKDVKPPYYGSLPVEDGKSRLVPARDDPVSVMAVPAPHPWRAEPPAPPGAADRRNTRLMPIAMLAILLCAGIAAFIIRKVRGPRIIS
jgi:hypothetical protein